MDMGSFMQQFVQQLINGISLGSIYALVALGYTMIRMVLPAIWKTFLKNSLDCWNVRTRFQERFPAVSSKCWLWDGL
jgi:hypothetical protein